MREYLKFFSIASVLTVTAVGLINFVIDPLQYFRRYELGAPVFISEQRYQNPGLARNYPYDTVIIGTSMEENFSPLYIREKTGWNTLKLAINGSNAYEQRRMLELALRTGKVKRVIWGVQWDALIYRPDAIRTEMGGIPEYLYGDVTPGLVKNYVLSLSTLLRSARVVIKRGPRNLEVLNTWNNASRFGCESVMQAMEDSNVARRLQARIRRGGLVLGPDAIAGNVTRNLVDVINAHHDVEFILFMPPYSAWFFRWVASVDDGALESFMAYRTQVARNLAVLPNVRIFDFQQLESIIFNPAYYKDLTHYSAEINKLMIDLIAKNENLPVAGSREFKRLIAAAPQTCRAGQTASSGPSL